MGQRGGKVDTTKTRERETWLRDTVTQLCVGRKTMSADAMAQACDITTPGVWYHLNKLVRQRVLTVEQVRSATGSTTFAKVKRPRTKGVATKGDETMAEQTTPVSEAHAAAATSSEAARRAKRMAMELLELSFNVEKGCYTEPGYSDYKIATESKLSVEAVAKLREEFYGPLRVNEALAGLRTEVQNVLRLIDSATTQIQSERNKLDNAMRSAQQQVATLDVQRKEYEARLNKLLAQIHAVA